MRVTVECLALLNANVSCAQNSLRLLLLHCHIRSPTNCLSVVLNSDGGVSFCFQAATFLSPTWCWNSSLGVDLTFTIHPKLVVVLNVPLHRTT